MVQEIPFGRQERGGGRYHSGKRECTWSTAGTILASLSRISRFFTLKLDTLRYISQKVPSCSMR